MPERPRHPARAVPGALLAAALVLGAVLPAAAQESDPLADDPPVDLGLFDGPVRLVAPEGGALELDSGRRLADTLELRPSPVGDGLVAVAEMDLETYVAGIAEMPAAWPMEALKAQAVAARTYAWWQAARGTYAQRGLPYDICATTACQVFRGLEVVEAPVVGARWQQAVDETAGQVLLHDGAPILARYFSTSGGATRNNEDVFPSSGSFPYLQGVEDPDDAVSPFHTWEVVFTRAQFDDLLSRGQTLSAATPVADVTVVQESEGRPNRVVVTGRDGTTAEVTAGQLQAFLNDVAPATFPADFPGPRRDGGRLPSTVPTTRYTVEVGEDHVVLDGSGWGHAVGMGQYGARGKADRGLTHAEILAAYYNGLTPTTTDAVPDRIRVGLADDLDAITIDTEGPVTVTAGGATLTERGFGSWRVAAGPDDTIGLVAPPGTGAPLVAAATTTTRTRPLPAEVLTLETVVNRPAELRVELRAGDEVVAARSVGVVDRGRRRAELVLADPEAGVLPAGRYEVALVAVDEDGTRAGTPAPIEVLPVGGGTMRSAFDGRDPLTAPSGTAPVVPALLGMAAGVLAGVMVRRRTEVRV